MDRTEVRGGNGGSSVWVVLVLAGAILGASGLLLGGCGDRGGTVTGSSDGTAAGRPVRGDPQTPEGSPIGKSAGVTAPIHP